MNTIENRMNSFRHILYNMADMVYDQLSDAFDAFYKDQKGLAIQIIDKDEQVNHYEANIHLQTIEILGRMQPLAKDLRLLIGGIRIANDLERMGDYAKSIAKYTIKHGSVDSEIMDSIADINKMLLSNVKETVDLLKDSSVKKAYEVAMLDDELDAHFKSLLYEIVDNKAMDIKDVLELTSVLRNIERAGDHAKNICEIVIYIENGEFIDFG